MEIQLGALAPSLVKQLRGRVPTQAARLFQKANESISYLKIHQLITDDEARRARKRLLKGIGSAITRHQR